MTRFAFAHWGLFEVDAAGALIPHRDDPDPSLIGIDQLDPAVEALRVRRPAIRRGWLEGRPGARNGNGRGQGAYVEPGWDEVLDILAEELRHVIADHGNDAIFGGSYGWASAGRFHHAQGQLHRFLNLIGGYTAHRNSYSHAAISVLLPHVVGHFDDLLNQQTSWPVMAEHTGLFVSFGGVPLKNAQVSSGGVIRHQVRDGLRGIAARGRIVNISPVRADLDAVADHDWIPIRPGTDVALMLALAHVLLDEGLADLDFLASHTVGFDGFAAYLRGGQGGAGGQVRSADWAAGITGIPAGVIRQLARDMAANRTMLNAAWALQRARFGEQPFWAMIALAAMLGQIGLPGGGFGLGYGSANSIGSAHGRSPGPTLPQGRNPTGRFIPVARIADALLNPGGQYRYDGADLTYPDLRLVYWAGGNPFHHHQDLNRLQRAWSRPETVIVHEQYWTPTARRADIVLPVSLTLERNDIGFSGREGYLVPMKAIRPPPDAAKSDHAILAALAARLGKGAEFDLGLDEIGWLRRLYDDWAGTMGTPLPDFDGFWTGGALLPARQASGPIVFLDRFRADPAGAPLTTPSGRIEIGSNRIAGFGLPDCPGHPVWLEDPAAGSEPQGKGSFHLLTNQPPRKLHSQLDHAPFNQARRVNGLEPVMIHPADAAELGLTDREAVTLWNARGRTFGAVVCDDGLVRGVAVMATGAWFDPGPRDAAPSDVALSNGALSDCGPSDGGPSDHGPSDGGPSGSGPTDPTATDAPADAPARDAAPAQGRDDSVNWVERNGNPNVLTRDIGTSALAQGSTAMTCRVWIAAAGPDLPEVGVYRLPDLSG